MAEITKELLLSVLSDIIDPELRIAIVDLGLIYDVKVHPGTSENTKKVEVDMTLTSIACPVGPALRQAVHNKCEEVEGVEEVIVNLIFSPPWDPRIHASEDAQMELGIM
jgi:metal-sulfur cluster biosynthetic enzyme